MKFEIRNVFKSIFCFTAYLLLGHSVFGQINNTFLSDQIRLNAVDSNRWGLSFTNFNYMRNTEYFGDIEKGRTLFGYQLNPSLFIQPNDHVKLQAGVFVQSEFGGNPAYSKVLPTFTLKINHGNTSFLFGTLEGALAHRLYEPLFDINSAIERRLENGFQLKHESKRHFLDVWINWEQFIERGSPYKEQFTAGFNYTPVMVENDKGFKLSVPMQATAFHRGGQIDTDTSNMIMVFNGAIGLEAQQKFSQGLIRNLQASLVSFHFQENTNSGYLPFRGGNGIMANAYVENKDGLGLMLSYWKGDQYIAPRGTAIYQSVSIDNPALTEQYRELIFVRLLYSKALLNGLTLSGRFEPFYNLKAAELEYSYSLYIAYNLNRSFGKLTSSK